MRKRTAEEREEESRAPTKEYKLVKIPTGRGTGNTPREPRRALSEAEKAARLAEMQQDNVKWRDEIRERNVTKGRKEDDEEKEEADKNGYAPSFIRFVSNGREEKYAVIKVLAEMHGFASFPSLFIPQKLEIPYSPCIFISDHAGFHLEQAFNTKTVKFPVKCIF